MSSIARACRSRSTRSGLRRRRCCWSSAERRSPSGPPQAYARQRGVGDRVVFAGTRSDPAPLLRAADVFVLPSAYEANALVVLEALATGLPVISTRVGFAPELVVDGENGYLVGRDAVEIGERLRDLGGPGLRDRSERARRTAERYSWSAVADRYIALAESLRSSGPAAREGRALATPRILHAIRSDGFAGVEQFVLRLASAQAQAGHHVARHRRRPVADAAAARGPRHRVHSRRPHSRGRPRSAAPAPPHRRGEHPHDGRRPRRGPRARVDAGRDRQWSRPATSPNRAAASDRSRSTDWCAAPSTRRSPSAPRSRRASTCPASSCARESTPGRFRDPASARTDGADRAAPRAGEGDGSRHPGLRVLRRGERRLGPRDRRARQRTGGPRAAGGGTRRRRRRCVSSGSAPTSRTSWSRAGILLAPCPNEGLGLTVLEAMATALPVIAADAGGHTELLIDLDARALFAARDVEAAAANLRCARTGPGGEGRAGRERAGEAVHAVHAATAGRRHFRRVSPDDRRAAAPPTGGAAMTDLVVMSLEAWDDVWRRNQHLVAGLLRAIPRCACCSSSPPPIPCTTWCRADPRPEGGRSPRSPASPRDACGGTGRSSGCPDDSTPTPTSASRARSCGPRESAGCRNPLLWINDPAPSPCR